MACQIELQEEGSITFAYVSEGCSALLEVSPDDCCVTRRDFMSLIHPEDISSFLETMQQSAQSCVPGNGKGAFYCLATEIKWVSLGSMRKTPRTDCVLGGHGARYH